MLARFEVHREEKKVYVFTEYDETIVKTFRSYAGKFDKEKKCWILPISRLPEVEKNIGTSSTVVEVEVPKEKLDHAYEQYSIGYYVLASRKDRDSPAFVSAELIRGTIPSSGGSAKNPCVNASEDSVFSLCVPLDFAKDRGLKIISKDEETMEYLQKQKEELIKQLEEINQKINDLLAKQD